VPSYSPGTRVRVEGLQNQTHYNGCEGVVSEECASHVCVRLDQDNKDIRIKLQNVRLLQRGEDA